MAKKKSSAAEQRESTDESAADKTPTTQTESFSRNLPVALTTEEIASRADKAAHLFADRASKEADMKAQQKHAKSELEEIEARLGTLSNEVRTKRTYKDVDCERCWDYRAGTVSEKRLDTGEVFNERAMTAHERQRTFQFNEAKPTTMATTSRTATRPSEGIPSE